MAPTVADHWAVPSASADNTTLTKSSYAVSNGDVIVLIGETWSRDHGLLTPTCSGQTVNTIQTAAPGSAGAFWGWLGVWTIKVTGNPGTITVSCAPADTANTRHTLFGIKCTGGDLDVSPATNATVTATGTTATVTLTTLNNGSIIVYGYVDLASQNPANTTYQSGATQLDIYDGHVGSNSVQASAWQSATTAGAQTIGIANTGSLTLTIVGVEIKAGSSSVTGTATDTVTTSDSPARTTVLPRAVADGATSADSPTRTAIHPRGTADSLTTADNPARQAIAPRATADSLTVSDTVSRTAVISRVLADTVTTADAPTRTVRLTRTGTDTVTITDAATLPGQIIEIRTVTIGPARRGWSIGPAERAWAIGPAETGG